MDRLTHERCNGIKSGYWSAAKKDELVATLAAYENTGLTPEEIRWLMAERSRLTKAAANCEDLCDSCGNRKPVDEICEDNDCDCWGCAADCICAKCSDGSNWRMKDGK